MIIVHSPADGGPVERFDFRSVRTAEASRITSMLTDKVPWQEVRKQLGDEHPDVMRCIAYVLKCRAQPELRISDFDPVVADLAVRLDRQEIEEWAEVAAATIAGVDLPAEVVQLQLSSILDEADDVDHARTVVERLVSGKFGPAPAGPTPAGPGPTSEGSTSSGPSSSDSSPTSSTSTDEPSTS
ncbi:hypothetical protein ACH4Q7_14865 [Streptomyces roseolus]|uniref:hypothetical protein n=1 Tax=Streptomyces roseolus TaxID=67358 RepID=UPI00379694FA